MTPGPNSQSQHARSLAPSASLPATFDRLPPRGHAQAPATSHARGPAAGALTLVLCAGLAAGVLGGVGASACMAQAAADPENPVFVNDSPSATDALARVRENLQAGNIEQAVRVLQRLLDTEPNALVGLPGDGAVFVSVRDRVHTMILDDASLRDAYRRAQSAPAEDLLNEGQFEKAERTRLLTPAGARAALRVAGAAIEAGRFESAWRTLASLRDHPDLSTSPSPALRKDAAEMALLLARYLDLEDLRRLAARWAGVGVESLRIEPVRGPERAASVSALRPQPAPSLEGVVARPLVSTTYWPGEPVEPMRLPAGINLPDQLPRYARELRVLPEIRGETLYLASQRVIAAFDLATLRERWKVDAAVLLGIDPSILDADATERRGGRGLAAATDDVRSLAVSGPFVVAGISAETGQGVEERELLVGLDSATGRVRWSVHTRDIDPQLDRARVRGPVWIDGDVAVVGLRKELRDRRLGALYLAGINVHDGSTRWVNLVGSAGQLPFYRLPQVADAGVVHRGVLYRTDRLGVAGAYSCDDGRVLWVRRLKGEGADSGQGATPWQISVPVVHEDRITFLSPDRQRVLTLELATGKLISEADATLFDQPSYLLAVGDKLACVGESTIVFTDLEQPGRGPRSEIRRVPEPGFRGRVVVAGDRLIAPMMGGILLVDPRDPAKGTSMLRLDEGGNVLSTGDQLVCVDDTSVHGFFAWSTVDRLLSERIARNPADAGAGVSLAEQAFRADRPDRIMAGVDAASAALRAAPASEPNQQARAHLVSALRAMLSPAGNAPTGIADLALRGQLLERLGPLAQQPADRAAYLMLLGEHQERQARYAEAAGTYQQLLDEPALGEVMWTGDRLVQRSDAEATRRLQGLLARQGRAVYAAIDQRAAAAFAALAPNAEPEAMEQLARRYPVAAATPALWGKIASAYETGGRPRAAARALELGLDAAERTQSAPAMIGELAGRLLTNLRDRGLLTAAQDALSALRSRHPALALSVAGQRVDAEALARELGERLSVEQRWPGVGAPGSVAQTLTGWALMEPAIRPTRPTTVGALVLRHEDGRVGVFTPPASSSTEALQPIWTSPPLADPVELVRLDRRSALMFIASPGGGLMQRVDLASGNLSWKSSPFPTFFAGGGERARAADRIRTPLEGLRLPSELLVSTDDRSVAMVERSGRCLLLDADSGATLWNATLPINQVFDCDVAGELLAVAGDRDVIGPAGTVASKEPVLVLLEARTGRVRHEIVLEDGSVRWLRLTSRGDLLLGCQNGIVAVDPETGRNLWRSNQPHSAGSLRAWVQGQSLLVVSSDRLLWRLSILTGAIEGNPIDTMGRLETGGEPVALPMDNDHLALCSPQGAVIIGPDGKTVGADALGATDNLLTPVAAQGVLVTMETGTSSRQQNPAPFNLHVLDARSGVLKSTVPLALGEGPTRLMLLDGRIALSAGHSTIIYSAPPANR
jgi:outer membrane protein assembly factor BamB